jgi:hypothetical protein
MVQKCFDEIYRDSNNLKKKYLKINNEYWEIINQYTHETDANNRLTYNDPTHSNPNFNMVCIFENSKTNYGFIVRSNKNINDQNILNEKTNKKTFKQIRDKEKLAKEESMKRFQIEQQQYQEMKLKKLQEKK